jgi:hypothetical protein
MHDGSQKTLEEVLAWYDKGGTPTRTSTKKSNRSSSPSKSKRTSSSSSKPARATPRRLNSEGRYRLRAINARLTSRAKSVESLKVTHLNRHASHSLDENPEHNRLMKAKAFSEPRPVCPRRLPGFRVSDSPVF